MSHTAKDEEIVERVRDGDEAAARLLLERYTPLLRRRVRQRLDRRVRRRIAESDVIQEAFIAVLRRLEEFQDRGEGSFGRWLGAFLDNKILDQVRRHVQTARRSVDNEQTRNDARAPERGAPAALRPSRRVATNEAVRKVEASLSGLPPDYRRVLQLVHFDGLRIEDAALALERSPGATRRLYGRAVSKLREALGHAEGGGA